MPISRGSTKRPDVDVAELAVDGLAMRTWQALAVAAFALPSTFGAAHAADRLGPLPVDPAQVSVSGISSGAFMANQLHVAHAAGITGAALVAGGLYGCAVDSYGDPPTPDGVTALISQATGACMSTPSQLTGPDRYADLVARLARLGMVDDPANLRRSRVYLFTGAADTVVDSRTVELAREVYRRLGVPDSNVLFSDRAVPAGHAWVTVAYGNPCGSNAADYIDRCGYDQAGIELTHIYGPLQPRADVPAGRIVAFDQTEFVPGGDAAGNGLSDTGYLFVPKACEPGAALPCRLQVALHGCLQSAEAIGDEFYTKVGLNEWADTNRIVVLYPQAHATSIWDLPWERSYGNALQTNPDGCWNWWGYAYDAKYLARTGVQVDAIWRMIRRIDGQP